LGNVYYLQGHLELALAEYKLALDLDSGAAGVHLGLSNVFRQLNRPKEAIRALEKAISLAPDQMELYDNLANLLSRQGRTREAVTIIKRAIARDPDNPTLGHLLAALSGKTTDAAPNRYVIDRFDSMATSFDRHLVKDLGYRTPKDLHRLLTDSYGDQAFFETMMDLGCGTGLSGQAFATTARHITGIDISARMLEKAGEKGIYHQLILGSITEILDRADAAYDLFVAADVFVYLGNLDPVFSAIRKRARPQALVLFSTESCDSETWQLCSTGRYAHGRGYIRDLADEHGFSILECRPENIRKEEQEWVRGDLFLLQLVSTATA